MLKITWILVILGCASAALAQDPKCAHVGVFDSKLPVYPPIARAAHMEAILHFAVVVYPDGHSDVQFVDGPSKGLNQVFVATSREYIESRRYLWVTGGEHHACTYTAEVEYEFSPFAQSPPNNFMRVTVTDLSHTLVEVKTTSIEVENSGLQKPPQFAKLPIVGE